MNIETARERVREARQELRQAVDAVMQIPSNTNFEQRITSLRRKSQLTRQLLEAQSELLLAIRKSPPYAIEDERVSPTA